MQYAVDVQGYTNTTCPLQSRWLQEILAKLTWADLYLCQLLQGASVRYLMIIHQKQFIAKYEHWWGSFFAQWCKFGCGRLIGEKALGDTSGNEQVTARCDRSAWTAGKASASDHSRRPSRQLSCWLSTADPPDAPSGDAVGRPYRSDGGTRSHHLHYATPRCLKTGRTLQGDEYENTTFHKS